MKYSTGWRPPQPCFFWLPHVYNWNILQTIWVKTANSALSRVRNNLHPAIWGRHCDDPYRDPKMNNKDYRAGLSSQGLSYTTWMALSLVFRPTMFWVVQKGLFLQKQNLAFCSPFHFIPPFSEQVSNLSQEFPWDGWLLFIYGGCLPCVYLASFNPA